MSISLLDATADFVAGFGATLKSVLKIIISHRQASFACRKRNVPLFILGNGPSLRGNIDKDMSLLIKSDTLAVNFAANAPEFTQIKPKYYVLADPHFFQNTTDPNVAKLISSINSVDWDMTMFIPGNTRLDKSLINNTNITICHFNFIAGEGFEWFENLAFSRRWAMPRPRNVLIPSIMIGIWLGYGEIRLLGADHSWLNTISVDNDNRVVTVQPHFYKEDEHECKRIRTAYLNLPLHSVLQSFYIAFRSYHRIKRYAQCHNVRILNCTPGSFIDAFTRADVNGNAQDTN